MNYKNNKPKKFTGCCGLCACRDRDQGLRNKRVPTLQELRAAGVDEQLSEYWPGEDAKCGDVHCGVCGVPPFTAEAGE